MPLAVLAAGGGYEWVQLHDATGEKQAVQKGTTLYFPCGQERGYACQNNRSTPHLTVSAKVCIATLLKTLYGVNRECFVSQSNALVTQTIFCNPQLNACFLWARFLKFATC